MKPLLVIDGDSLAHRAYHALPKSMRRAEGKPSNALVGFSNFLMRLWQAEAPRAALVGWDTLFVPTYRNELFAGYQGGRVFDDELVEQLDLLPELVRSFGFAAAKGAGYEADDFLAAAVAYEEKQGGHAVVVTSDRDAFQLASEQTTILQPTRGVSELARVGRRARAGAGLHRVARRPVGQAARSPGSRPEDGGQPPGAVRDVGGDARGRALRGAGGGTSYLPANGNARRLRPSTSPR